MKNLKNGPKSGRENNKAPVKNQKKRPKMVFTGTFFFSRVKKKIGGATLPNGCRRLSYDTVKLRTTLFNNLNLLIFKQKITWISDFQEFLNKL